ncbi:MAG: FAD-dependent monooxygenase [Burkholderiaceae bacterium]
MNQPRPRIRITGSGPVAMALALWLRRQGIGPGRIDWPRRQRPLPEAMAARAIALSAGSVQLLERVMPMPRAAAIHDVDVRIEHHPGSLRMTHDEHGLPALGQVVRYGELVAALDSACRVAGFGAEDAQPQASPADETAAIEICADGDTGADAERREFGQCALLAELEAGRERHGVAFECFTANGPLALLPLPESHRHSLVWCDRPEACHERAVMPAADFEAALADAFGDSLGRLRLVSPRHVAPLARSRRRDTFDGRRIMIGNAAQALHPVAGQGLNLGLRDAFELAQALGDADDSAAALRAACASHARSRRRDRLITIGATDRLAEMFATPMVRGVASMLLSTLDLVPPVRRGIAKGFMFGWRS